MSDEEKIIDLLEAPLSDTAGDESDDYFNGDGPPMNKIKKENPCDEQSRNRTKGKPTIIEKRKLAGLIRKERALWDVLDDRYNHGPTRSSAWNRIAAKMPNRTVEELKTMWKSLTDLVRYRKKQVEASGEDFEWEMKDSLLFILERISTRKGQSADKPNVLDLSRSSASDSRHFDDSSTPPASEIDVDHVGSVDPLTPGPRPILAARRNSSATTTTTEPTMVQTPFRYAYAWQHLERLYQKLGDDDIEELNVEFINRAYQKIKSKQTTGQRR